jgi:hypothetical protein
MENKKDKIDEFIAKTLSMKKQDRMDLSSDEDLSIAIMNMISLEEHFFFSGAKTKNPMYFDLLGQVREIRKQLLKRIIKEYEGEVWCISKHLLAASMRLMEYGTKLQTMNKKEEAIEMFEKSYEMYSLFWGLNLNLIDTGSVKQYAGTSKELKKEMDKEDSYLNQKDSNEKALEPKTKGGFLSKLGDMVKKAIDCCIE